MGRSDWWRDPEKRARAIEKICLTRKRRVKREWQIEPQSSRSRKYPPRDELIAHLRYDPETGSLWWLTGKFSGRLAGGLQDCGYRVVYIFGTYYRAHRLAWILAHGDIPEDALVDHINRIPSDNRLCNLRLATAGQNSANSKSRTVRAKGTKQVASTGHWTARIRSKGKEIYLGVFKTEAEAAAAYARAAAVHHGEFARSDLSDLLQATQRGAPAGECEEIARELIEYLEREQASLGRGFTFAIEGDE